MMGYGGPSFGVWGPLSTVDLCSVCAVVGGLRGWGGREVTSGSGGHVQGPVLATLEGGEVGHPLTTLSLPDHVLPTGLNEVHREVFSVPWRVCP